MHKSYKYETHTGWTDGHRVIRVAVISENIVKTSIGGWVFTFSVKLLLSLEIRMIGSKMNKVVTVVTTPAADNVEIISPSMFPCWAALVRTPVVSWQCIGSRIRPSGWQFKRS